MMPTNLSANPETSTSIRRSRIGLIIGSALIAGTGFAWVLVWSGERAHRGSIQSRTTVVKSNCVARIRDVSVKPGQSVAPGDPLFQLIDLQLEERLIGKRREIAELEAEVNRARIGAEVDFAWRRRELQSEVFETQLKEGKC